MRVPNIKAHMRCFAQFGCHLYNLKKRKTPMGECSLLYGYFSRFVNCTNNGATRNIFANERNIIVHVPILNFQDR